jgi:type IV secretory pathway VirB2 component (pilin)|nr:TrbC/VirB2 family protein [uncultured Rhodopila sp.]
MTKLIDQRAALALACTLIAAPAFAQGSVDPATSLQSILTWGLTIAGIVIAVICLFKGIHAVADGRHIGPTLIGLVVGTAICFGGAAIVTHFGVG